MWLGSLLDVPWLGCCEPTALSAYASVPESQIILEKIVLADTGRLWQPRYWYNIGTRLHYDAKAQHCNSRSARGTCSGPLRVYICYDCWLKHHSHALKAIMQESNRTAFDIDTGACGLNSSHHQQNFQMRCSLPVHQQQQHSKADDALSLLPYHQDSASCKHGM